MSFRPSVRGQKLCTLKLKNLTCEVRNPREVWHFVSFCYFFWHIKKKKKRYTNFGQNGGDIWKIIEIGIDMYIYSWSGGKNMSVRPPVRPCAKVMYTKTQERVKIIECGFFCLKGVYWESKLPKFRPERTKIYEARAEWNF